MTTQSHTKKALQLAGGPSVVARHFKIRPWAVSKWRDKDEIPAERVIPVVLLINGQVTPHELRPDIYPDPDWMPQLNPNNDEAANA